MTMGPSMLPTLSLKGDTLLVDRTLNLPNWLCNALNIPTEPEVGDIVLAKSPTDSTQTVCKRVVAKGGQLSPCGKMVPPGKVWLEGDNKPNSTDSRVYGPIPLALVEGRALCRVWPPSKAGRLAEQPSSPENGRSSVAV